jgi:predicted transcriptional regulator
MDARAEIAAALEEALHPSVIGSFDILKPVGRMRLHRRISDMDWLYSFQQEILSLIERIGYKVIPLHRCPFEAISKERRNLLLTIAQRYNSSLRERAQVMKDIARITKKHAVIFTDRYSGRSIEGTAIIKREELKRIRYPEEILDMIMERGE